MLQKYNFYIFKPTRVFTLERRSSDLRICAPSRSALREQYSALNSNC